MVPQAESFGCTIHFSESSSEEITYARHVAPILQRNCQTCHRPDQVAPFSLLTYQEAKTWSTEIVAYTQNRLMPPWKAAPGYGEFKRERQMQDWEIELLAEWTKNEMLEGKEEELPIPMAFTDEWVLGQPDLIGEMPEAYDVPTDGEDEYRHFIIPTGFGQDMYVSAVDVQPGNSRTVHHVIVYLDTSGRARELDAEDSKPGYARFGDTGFEIAGWLGGWAPGITPSLLPAGTGYRLPQGADIVLQVHYYKTGRIERDRSRVGVYFCKLPDPKPVNIQMAINDEFQIPAGENNYRVEAKWRAEEDVYAISVLPHMHLIGRDIRIEAAFPDDRRQDLIWIQDWDFNWQEVYHFRQPIFMPTGTIVKAVGHFDNSVDNPRNPNHPPQPIGWGEKTTDEMFIAFLDVIRATDYQPEISDLMAGYSDKGGKKRE